MANASTERRKHNRSPLPRPAECTVISDGQWMGAHLCENISVGGALIIGPGGLRVGDKVALTVTLSESDSIEVDAEVRRAMVRSPFASAYGLAFQNVSAEQAEQIGQTIAEGLVGHQ